MVMATVVDPRTAGVVRGTKRRSKHFPRDSDRISNFRGDMKSARPRDPKRQSSLRFPRTGMARTAPHPPRAPARAFASRRTDRYDEVGRLR